MPEVPSICVYGHHELWYPRNRTVIGAFKAMGYQLYLCHSRIPFPFRHLHLLYKFFKCPLSCKLVYVTEGGHRLVPLLKLFTTLTSRKLIFDPFISRYNTRIQDRQLYSPHGPQSWICKWQDWSSCRSADFLIFDTMQHKDYFYDRYGLKKPWGLLPVSVDESVFQPIRSKNNPVVFKVLFYGTFIPLQGIQHIIQAAGILTSHQDITFTIIGNGQTLDLMKKEAARLNLSNLTHIPNVQEDELPEYIAGAHVCLGIFGGTIKAAQVVPNKVVQSAAMGKAIITADTPAIREFFVDQQDICLVPAANSTEIAKKILLLKSNNHLRENLECNSIQVFKKFFSQEALISSLGKVFKEIE